MFFGPLIRNFSRRPWVLAAVSLFIAAFLFTVIFNKLPLLSKKDEGIWTNLLTVDPERRDRADSRTALTSSENDPDVDAGPKPDLSDSVKSQTLRALPVLKILVLTYNRHQSLRRLLESLDAAEYDRQPVSIEIHIDRHTDGIVHKETLDVAKGFRFQHGDIQVMVKPRHCGVIGQWLGSWKVPEDDKAEIAVFIEDDISVSPFFARWLRMVHTRYDDYPAINGYSLQEESIKHATGASGRLQAPEGQSVFLYPVLGSWGFSPNTRWWRHFLGWYNNVSRDPKYVPFVKGLMPSDWYQQLKHKGRADSMWTMWHIDHAHKNELYTLYGRWPGGDGGAFNFKEVGEHYLINEGAGSASSAAKVLRTWRAEDFVLPEALVMVNAKGELTGKKMTAGGVV